jgi:hypothetical protein
MGQVIIQTTIVIMLWLTMGGFADWAGAIGFCVFFAIFLYGALHPDT